MKQNKGSTAQSLRPFNSSRYDYYLTGILLAIALSLAPAIVATARDYGRKPPLDMSQSEIFLSSLFLFSIALSSYLYIARVFRITKWNVFALFLLAGVAVFITRFLLGKFANVHFDFPMYLFYSVAEVLFLIIQIPLAIAHAKRAT